MARLFVIPWAACFAVAKCEVSSSPAHEGFGQAKGLGQCGATDGTVCSVSSSPAEEGFGWMSVATGTARRIPGDHLLLQVGKDSARKQALAKTTPDAQTCNVADWVLEATRRTVNGALNLALRLLDPRNVTLKAVRKEVKLLGCSAGVDMNASVRVAGFKDAHVASLRCASQKCVQQGTWGCKVTDWTFHTTISLGNTVKSDGFLSGNWLLCGFSNPCTVDIGVDNIKPNVAASIVIRQEARTWQMDMFTIHSVDHVYPEWGALENHNCGFTTFNGNRWCGKIINWLAGKVQVYLKDDVDNLLGTIINKKLEERREAPVV